jgi:hypothetical protein
MKHCKITSVSMKYCLQTLLLNLTTMNNFVTLLHKGAIMNRLQKELKRTGTGKGLCTVRDAVF